MSSDQRVYKPFPTVDKDRKQLIKLIVNTQRAIIVVTYDLWPMALGASLGITYLWEEIFHDLQLLPPFIDQFYLTTVYADVSAAIIVIIHSPSIS